MKAGETFPIFVLKPVFHAAVYLWPFDGVMLSGMRQC